MNYMICTTNYNNSTSNFVVVINFEKKYKESRGKYNVAFYLKSRLSNIN